MQQNYADALAAVGLVCSGLASGLTLAYPLLVNKHFQWKQGHTIDSPSETANLTLAQRLTLWNHSYNFGHWCPLFALGAAVGLTASSSSLGAKSGGHGIADTWKQQSLIVASLLHVSIAPFTVLAIAPTNARLISLRKAANSTTTKLDDVSEEEVDDLLTRWVSLHNVRALLSFAAFALAVTVTVQA